MSTKIVLAFSGGLDTSFCIPYLIEQGFEVHTVTVNTGGFSAAEEEALTTRALALGAASHKNIDAVGYYYSSGVKYLIFGNILKNATYPLSVSSERVFQAIKVLEHVRELGAGLVAHGCTGAGNDQVRFDLVFEVLAPEIEIVAPIRTLGLSRQQEIDYLVQKGFDFDWRKSAYSINKGLWGTSVGGVETLASDGVVPDEAYPSAAVETEPVRVVVGFERGEPISLNGENLDPVKVIARLNEIGGRYAVGRDVHVGDTIIGIKGRVAFEAAAPLIIIKAHHLLEKHTLTKWQLYWKDQLAGWYGQMMHEGQYLDPLARNIEGFLADIQQFVTGTVELELRPYHFSVLGCRSAYDLMKSKFADYGEANRSLSAQDMVGFTRVLANPLKIYYSVHNNSANDHD